MTTATATATTTTDSVSADLPDDPSAEGSGPPPLSAALRVGTAGEHRTAESAPFVEELVSGTVSLARYALYLRQLHAVYAAIEAAAGLLAHDDVPAAGLVAPGLHRAPALAADLDRLAGPGWGERLPVHASTAGYVERIRARCAVSVAAFAAHAYTRYLGDLAGGQVIASGLRRAGAVDDDALAFYRFEAGVHPLRQEFRSRLDGLTLSPEERDDAVDEARAAFRHNHAVLVELGAA